MQLPVVKLISYRVSSLSVEFHNVVVGSAADGTNVAPLRTAYAGRDMSTGYKSGICICTIAHFTSLAALVLGSLLFIFFNLS